MWAFIKYIFQFLMLGKINDIKMHFFPTKWKHYWKQKQSVLRNEWNESRYFSVRNGAFLSSNKRKSPVLPPGSTTAQPSVRRHCLRTGLLKMLKLEQTMRLKETGDRYELWPVMIKKSNSIFWYQADLSVLWHLELNTDSLSRKRLDDPTHPHAQLVLAAMSYYSN